MLCKVQSRHLIMSIKLHEFYYTEVKEGEFRSMRTAAGWSLMALLQPFPTFHCIISYAFVFALSLVTTLSSPPCFYFFHLFPPSSLCLSLSLSLSLSLNTLLIQNTSMNLSCLHGKDDLSSLFISPSFIYLSASSVFLPFRLFC